MPGFGGFAAVPEGYNEAEKNQQIVQALMLDLQQKQAQQQASGLAFGAFSHGAQQPGATPIPGAQPTGLPPPPTQAALAPGAGITPAGPAPGAPASIPGATPAPTGASGVVPGQSTSIIGNSGQPNTLRVMAANRYPGNQQTAQAINYVANALGVSPDQPLTPTQQSNANQMFPNLDPGGGIVPPTTAAPGQVQAQPIPPPVQTAAIPGGQPGVAPPAGGTPAPQPVPIPQGRPAGMGPGMPAGTSVSGAAAGGAGTVGPVTAAPAAPPPAAGGAPGAGAPQPGRQPLSWQDSVNWINQEADRQEQQTGRKISPQQRWMALQQMLPFMTEDAKAQHEQALADLKRQQEEEIKRKDLAQEEQKRQDLTFKYKQEEDRHAAAEERIANTTRDIERKEASLQETIRSHNVTAAQKAQAEQDLQEIRIRKAVNEEARTAETSRYHDALTEYKYYSANLGAQTKENIQKSRAETQIKTTEMRDEAGQKRVETGVAGRLEAGRQRDVAAGERQDKALEARLKQTMMSGSPSAQVMRDWMAKHKDATDAEVDAKLRSLPTAGGAALEYKEKVAVGKIQTVQHQITRAMNDLQASMTGGKPVTGFGGLKSRIGETISDYAGWSSEHEAGKFKQLIEALKTDVPRALADTPRIGAADREKIDNIVAGLSPFDTPQKSLALMKQLYDILQDKLQTQYGLAPGAGSVDPAPPEIVPHLKAGQISTFIINGETQAWTINDIGEPMRMEVPSGKR